MSTKKWRDANPERVAAARKKYWETNREAIAARAVDKRKTRRALSKTDVAMNIEFKLPALYKRCKRDGIPMTIKKSDLVKTYHDQNGVCPLTGRVLEFGPDASPFNLMSIDRVKSELGYVPGNVRWVVSIANSARGAGTDDDLLQLAMDIVSTLK